LRVRGACTDATGMITRGQWRRRALCGLALGAGLALLRVPAGARGAEPPEVWPRDAWGAAPPGPGMRPHAIERVTVHHTGPPSWYGVPPAAVYLRAIQSFHQGAERRWPDIAYHLLIDLDGGVWEGRALAFAGDSATVYDPAGHALIAVVGDYDEQHPNRAQLDALAAIARWLCEAYGLDRATLGAHRDYAATACPGAQLYGCLEAVRASL
jgi:hypothetical protein